jgi:hypothetical protein
MTRLLAGIERLRRLRQSLGPGGREALAGLGLDQPAVTRMRLPALRRLPSRI